MTEYKREQKSFLDAEKMGRRTFLATTLSAIGLGAIGGHWLGNWFGKFVNDTSIETADRKIQSIVQKDVKNFELQIAAKRHLGRLPEDFNATQEKIIFERDAARIRGLKSPQRFESASTVVMIVSPPLFAAVGGAITCINEKSITSFAENQANKLNKCIADQCIANEQAPTEESIKIETRNK